MTDEQVSPDGTAADMDEGPHVEIVTPIVVDLGRTRRKQIKLLKKGRGKLSQEVVDVLDEVVETLGDELEGKALVPVVMIYERKGKRKRRRSFPF